MKSIKFSEKELGFIRQQYQVELEEAEEYVENLKVILKKIGAPEAITATESIGKEPSRRGRKATFQKEFTSPGTETRGKKRKIRSDKGVKRGKKPKSPVSQKSVGESTPATDS